MCAKRDPRPLEARGRVRRRQIGYDVATGLLLPLDGSLHRNRDVGHSKASDVRIA